MILQSCNQTTRAQTTHGCINSPAQTHHFSTAVRFIFTCTIPSDSSCAWRDKVKTVVSFDVECEVCHMALLRIPISETNGMMGVLQQTQRGKPQRPLVHFFAIDQRRTFGFSSELPKAGKLKPRRTFLLHH